MGLSLSGISGASGILSPLLLDQYPGAFGAYSLKRLSTGYTGPSVRVRRSSDNTEQDIGFIGSSLDTAALTSFVGSGNGFVRTFYDQSGNARSITQTNTTRQPLVVEAGALKIMSNGAPGIHFNGSRTMQWLSTPDTIAVQGISILLSVNMISWTQNAGAFILIPPVGQHDWASKDGSVLEIVTAGWKHVYGFNSFNQGLADIAEQSFGDNRTTAQTLGLFRFNGNQRNYFFNGWTSIDTYTVSSTAALGYGLGGRWVPTQAGGLSSGGAFANMIVSSLAIYYSDLSNAMPAALNLL